MGTGYQRADVSNQIANGQVIDADVFDLEFDALVDAFNTSTGHTHDGTTAEGGPITILGPTQDVTISATEVLPTTTNTVSIGSSSARFKDLFLEGNVDIDGTLNVEGASTLATVNGNVVFTGSVVVPNSPDVTHALNTGVADTRYLAIGASSATVTTDLTFDGDCTFSQTGSVSFYDFSVTTDITSVRDITTTGAIKSSQGKILSRGVIAEADHIYIGDPTDDNVTGFNEVTFFLKEASGDGNSKVNFVFFDANNPTKYGRIKQPLSEISGAPSELLWEDVADTLYQAASSSLRYKDNAQVDRHSATVEDLGEIRRWEWGGELSEDDHLRGREGWGLIAEDVVKVLPEAAVYDAEGKLSGLQALPLIALLVQEIKDLKQRLDK